MNNNNNIKLYNKNDNIINILNTNIECVNNNLIKQNTILSDISYSFNRLIEVIKPKNNINNNYNSKNKVTVQNKFKQVFKEEHKYYFYVTNNKEIYKYSLKTIYFKNNSTEATVIIYVVIVNVKVKQF